MSAAIHLPADGLQAEIGRALAGAGVDPATSTPRPCPVCLVSSSSPDFRAPVYAFHRCRRCSLRYTPRLLRPEVVRARYTDTALGRARRDLLRIDALAGPDPEVHAALLDPALERVPSRGRAIAVGCGFGRMVAALRPRFDQAIGLELDPAIAGEARRIFRADVRAVPLQDLDVPPGSVDLVVAHQVLDRIADLAGLLAAARLVLRPGGVLLCGVPHGDSLGMRLRPEDHPFVATHRIINLFTLPSLRALATGAGFQVHELRSDDDLDVPAGALAALAERAHLPSRLGRGAHLQLVATKSEAQ